jgi:L-iditol 2-dehydrogenase
MLAARIYGPCDVRLEEMPEPEPGYGEVVIKIKAALTCGTDAKVYKAGGHPRMITLPATFGHEFSGLISDAGKGVEGFEKGMRVVAANSAPCGRCFYCRMSRESMCEDLLFINGAYAQYILIPERVVKKNLLNLPQDVSFKEACLVEPLACVIHGVEESGIRIGDTVAINGTGPIGLMYVRMAKLKGSRVIATDCLKERLKIAENMGADETVNVAETKDAVAKVRSLTPGGRGADVVIEASGVPEVWEKSVEMARPGGIVNLFGGCRPGSKMTIDTTHFHYNELTIKAIFHHTPFYVRLALEMIRRKAAGAEFLITHEFPLEKLQEALNMLASGQGIKIAIIPPD